MNNKFSFLLTEYLNIVKRQFGLTTKIISKEVGISPNTVTNWKKNSNKINKQLLKRFYNYLECFKEKNKEQIKSHDSFITLIELLQSEILNIFNSTNIKTDKNIDIKLAKNRKKYFQINFNNFIEFIKETARLYETDYETLKSEYLRVEGYQKKELYDNLVYLDLISKSGSGNFPIQKKLAKLLDVSEAQISRWKKGLDYPSNENLNKIGKLCNINSDFPFSLYEISKEQYSSMFLKSPHYSMQIQEFEREYLFMIKSVIKSSGYLSIFENEIKENCYLIAYEGEDIEEVSALIRRDCIMLLKKTFDILNYDITFEKWLLEKINNESVLFYSFKNESIKLNTARDCYKFAEDIDYGYKVLRNYLFYNESFERVDDFILNKTSLFSIASFFMSKLQVRNEIFSEWLETTSNLFSDEKFFREECRNLCNSLYPRDKDNNIDYINAFFEQFWKFILYKNSSINTDIWPIDRVFFDISNEIDGVLNSIKLNYRLLEKIIKKINKSVVLQTESTEIMYKNLVILEDGKELFEEILYNDAWLIYKKKLNESGEEFEIVQYLKLLNEKVEQFQNKWNLNFISI